MGNKAWEMYCSYIDPDEIADKTPAKRLYSVAGPYKATSVSRTMSQFWKEMADYGWTKRDVVLIGVMPGGLTPDMKKDFEEEDDMGEDDHLDDVEADAQEELELDDEDDDEESDEYEEDDEE